MKTYWENFIKKYERRLVHTSLSKTLEAFYHYCNIHKNKTSKKKCDDIMNM